MARRVEMKRALVASVSSPQASTCVPEKKVVVRHAILLSYHMASRYPIRWCGPLNGLDCLLSKVYNWRDHHRTMSIDRLSGPFRSRFAARLRRQAVIGGVVGSQKKGF